MKDLLIRCLKHEPIERAPWVPFAGVHAGADGLSLAPVLPEEWDGYCLPVTYRGRRLEIAVSKEEKKLCLVSGEPLEVTLFGQKIMLSSEAAF